uniref:Amino Acid/Auxin Permease (AAAP) Family putative n=1 Tax=Albugo laibachii Nc14 TaxID=890382 RepID=F0WTM1_9STRA|nr:Amino Acid/Auxin Permease (AAAP) Family putative [Albugo laibachii Nc14]|eukprot:CCA24713.1 Amino Acid/Auxin Permease (AAAP) Family putative [Albugo laibachii Nc14]
MAIWGSGVWGVLGGGTLLVGLFPGTLSSSIWIIFMAVGLLPICLTPMLKVGASAALVGCAATISTNVIVVIVLLYGMRGHPSVPEPDLTFQ